MSRNFSVGDRVVWQGNTGVIKFIGPADFAGGEWYGLELDEAVGKNDGTVEGKSYFECEDGKGIFVRKSHLRKESSRLASLRAKRSAALKKKDEIVGSSPGAEGKDTEAEASPEVKYARPTRSTRSRAAAAA